MFTSKKQTNSSFASVFSLGSKKQMPSSSIKTAKIDIRRDEKTEANRMKDTRSINSATKHRNSDAQSMSRLNDFQK